jgi:hypothetical protein
LFSSERKFEPGILLIVVLMPICPRLLLDQHRGRLVGGGKAEIERERGLEAVRVAGFRHQLLGFLDVGVELMRLRPCDLGRLVGRRAEHGFGEAVLHRRP